MKFEKLQALVQATTKDWKRQKIAEIRDKNALRRRFREQNKTKNQKEVAFEHMRKAYMKASDNGTLPANQRQIMYALRPMVIAEVPDTDPSKFDRYFHKTLLDEYLDAYKPDWADNVVRDARGALQEPHTGRTIELGTLAVRSYLERVKSHKVSNPSFDLIEGRYPTFGPKHAFGAILFVEKEGFEPLFDAAQIKERFDIAIMSTKGMSVRAARQLIDELYRFNVPVFVLHDFDKHGFSIFGTLGRDSIRYKFRHRHKLEIIDIGLRLEDVEELGLESEPQFNDVSDDTLDSMRSYGCTEAELEFILGESLDGDGERVELNAMTSRQLVDLIEDKLREHGVKKIVPSDAELATIYAREVHMLEVQRRVDRIVAKQKAGGVKPPKGLAAKIRSQLKKHPEQRWDAALREIAMTEKRR